MKPIGALLKHAANAPIEVLMRLSIEQQQRQTTSSKRDITDWKRSDIIG
jgi:hypothetical protein